MKEAQNVPEGNDGIYAYAPSSVVKAECLCGAGTKVGKDPDEHSKGDGRGWAG